MKKFLPILILMVILSFSSLTQADSGRDSIFYAQVVDGQKTIYYAQSDGTNQRVIVKGKDVKFFLIRKHFLYYTNHQLYEYDLASQKARPLTRFTEDLIDIKDMSDKPDAPDQALIIAETAYERNLYILEFSDGSTRMVQNSFSSGTENASSIRGYSPDQTALAVVHQAAMKYRFELYIQEKVNGKLKTSWTLPNNMTIIPELPLWAPNSRMVAFYARQFDGLAGFYSLYLYHLNTKKLQLVQEQVFSKMPFSILQMGSFIPEWSQDSNYLIFQYQPYGLPTESLILKYDVAADKTTTLTSSLGHNLYPSWSPSGKSILFLSNRESFRDQVYTMDPNGENLKRISPPEGYTEWVSWYKENN
jgi:Tol biopolymer transport system component